MTKVIEKRKGDLRGYSLPKGEVVPLMSDNLFKKVYADSNHLERLNYLLSTILKKDVKVIRILNAELIGDSRLNRRKCVDLVCQIDDREFINIEINTSYATYERNRNLEFLFRLASSDYKVDISLPKIERDRLRRLKKHYLQINFNTINTNNKPFTTLSIIDNEDVNYKLTDMIEIMNINVSYYRDLCYTKSTQELSELEIAIGMMGVYQEELLNKVSKRNKVLKEISEIMKKFSWEDDAVKYDWMYNRAYWYWTMTSWQDGDQPSSSAVWRVRSDGSLYASGVSNNDGAVRPVINVYKSKISS